MSEMRRNEELLELLRQTSPLLTRAGLISFDVDSKGFRTVLGVYPIGDDPVEAVNRASLELEAELPRYYALRMDGEDVEILQRHVAEDGSESLKVVRSEDIEDDDISVLKSIISAQGGMFKRYGVFRFDLNLHRQGLLNCSHCGEIWKSMKHSPLRCPRCRNELPPVIRNYHNVFETTNLSEFLTDIRNSNFKALNKDDILRSDNIFLSYNKIGDRPPFRDEHARSLQNALTLIGEEYDAEHLNLVRMPEVNSGIIELLKESESSLVAMLREEGFPDVRTESVRPIGNWPHTAWISISLVRNRSDDDPFPQLSCMLMLDISSPRWALCLIPNVKEMMKKHGSEWLYVFNPMREEMRSRLTVAEKDMIVIEGIPEIDTVPNSPGARMVSASVAHAVIEPERDGPIRMKRKIVRMMEALRELE